jgi:hypothetical protein
LTKSVIKVGIVGNEMDRADATFSIEANIAGTSVRPLSRLVGIDGPEVFCLFDRSPAPNVRYQRRVAVVPGFGKKREIG